MSRSDQRTAYELRPLALSQGVLSRADGSAKYSFGERFLSFYDGMGS